MRHYPHRPPCMYAEAAGALADYLAPHQVAVGVPGGLDILVHGVRAYLRAQPELVVVRLDLRNAYNEIDRCAALRRLAAVPELAHLAPLFHVLHAPVARLQLSTGRSLFDGVAGRESDSEEGMRQGSAESSAVFCVGITPSWRRSTGSWQWLAAPLAATLTTCTRAALPGSWSSRRWAASQSRWSESSAWSCARRSSSASPTTSTWPPARGGWHTASRWASCATRRASRCWCCAGRAACR